MVTSCATVAGAGPFLAYLAFMSLTVQGRWNLLYCILVYTCLVFIPELETAWDALMDALWRNCCRRQCQPQQACVTDADRARLTAQITAAIYAQRAAAAK